MIAARKAGGVGREGYSQHRQFRGGEGKEGERESAVCVTSPPGTISEGGKKRMALRRSPRGQPGLGCREGEKGGKEEWKEKMKHHVKGNGREEEATPVVVRWIG